MVTVQTPRLSHSDGGRVLFFFFFLKEFCEKARWRLDDPRFFGAVAIGVAPADRRTRGGLPAAIGRLGQTSTCYSSRGGDRGQSVVPRHSIQRCLAVPS